MRPGYVGMVVAVLALAGLSFFSGLAAGKARPEAEGHAKEHEHEADPHAGHGQGMPHGGGAGRYQMIMGPDRENLWLVDTREGRVWHKPSPAARWREDSPPVNEPAGRAE